MKGFLRRSSLCLIVCIAVFTGLAFSAAKPNIALLGFTGRTNATFGPGGFGAVLDKGEELLQAKYGSQLNFTRKLFLSSYPIRCDELESIAAVWASQFYYSAEARDIAGMVMIGPDCIKAATSINYMAKEWNVPIFSPQTQMLNSELYDNRAQYPTLTRIAPFIQDDLDKVIRAVLTALNRTTVALLCDDASIYGRAIDRQLSSFIVLCQTLRRGLEKDSKTALALFYANTANTSHVQRTLVKATSFATDIFIIVPADRIRSILLAASDQGLIGGEYMYFTVHPWQNTDTLTWYSEADSSLRNEDAFTAFSSLLTIAARSEDTPEKRDFTDVVKKISKQKYGYTFSRGEEVDPYVMSYYYTLAIYGQVLNETLANGGNLNDGAALCKSMWNRTYTVLGNDVVINANGDRSVDWMVTQMGPDANNTFKPVMEIVMKFSARYQQLQVSRDFEDYKTIRQDARPNKRSGSSENKRPSGCSYQGTENGCSTQEDPGQHSASSDHGTSMPLYAALNATADWLSSFVSVVQQFRQALGI